MAQEQGPVVDWFAVLGLTPDATDTDVRRAYRARARDSHPDRGGDAATFLQLSRAYEALRTETGRADIARRVRGRGPGGGAGPDGPPGAGTGPAPAGPSRRRRPDEDAGRLSDSEQDRLVGEFFRDHPDATGPARARPSPAGSTGPEAAASEPTRGAHGPGGRLLPVLAGAGLAGVVLVLLLPDLVGGLVGAVADALSR